MVGGPSIYEGNVLLNSRPICDDSWDDADATVLCRMLGYESGIATQHSAYGLVEKNFMMDDVQCSGDEVHLHQCSYSSTHNCRGDEAAGVICIPGGSCIYTGYPGGLLDWGSD